MKKITRILCTATVVTLINGCASMSQPKRDLYTGMDNVGVVNASMVAGTWQGRVLNPIKGGEDMDAFNVVYAPDGTSTLTGTIKDTSGVMSDMALEVSGTWTVEGEMIVARTETVKETSGTKLGGFMANLMSPFKENMTGKTNVFELTENRMVVVAEDDWQAQELTRVE